MHCWEGQLHTARTAQAPLLSELPCLTPTRGAGRRRVMMMKISSLGDAVCCGQVHSLTCRFFISTRGRSLAVCGPRLGFPYLCLSAPAGPSSLWAGACIPCGSHQLEQKNSSSFCQNVSSPVHCSPHHSLLLPDMEAKCWLPCALTFGLLRSFMLLSMSPDTMREAQTR